jgi:hypothetical protein
MYSINRSAFVFRVTPSTQVNIQKIFKQRKPSLSLTHLGSEHKSHCRTLTAPQKQNILLRRPSESNSDGTSTSRTESSPNRNQSTAMCTQTLIKFIICGDRVSSTKQRCGPARQAGVDCDDFNTFITELVIRDRMCDPCRIGARGG